MIIQFTNWATTDGASRFWDRLYTDVIKPLHKRDVEFIFHLGNVTKKHAFEVEEILDIMGDYSSFGKVTLVLSDNEADSLYNKLNGPPLKTIEKYRFLYNTMKIDVLLITNFNFITTKIYFMLKDIVLVHGAFADGSSWSGIIPILQAKGFNVIAVQNPLTSLEDDVAATKRALALMDGPVLLVGHSYGGMVVTEAGNDPKVSGLLYVCALVPNDGQSAADVTQAYPSPGSAEFKLDDSGFLSMSSKGIHEHFAQDLTPEQRDIIYATQVPWAAKATTGKISKAAWKTKPSWYIVGTDDHMVIPELARAKAKMIKATTIELQSSHVPMLSMPDKVADFIVEAVEKLAGVPLQVVQE
jgi:pimeloyl-ACP methyl ester carboxylesterase